MATVLDLGQHNPGYVLAAIVGAVLVVLALITAAKGVTRGAKAARDAKRGHADDVLTFVVAGMATATSAQGMWNFFDDSLGVNQIYLRALMFSMFEAAMLVCALRTRRAIKEGRPAGIEGPAVWVMAALSGILAATDAGGVGAAMARLAAPLVAAFLWERGLTAERQRAGKSVINWRISPERILVRLGVAEASERTAGDVDAHRRITRVARAAKELRLLRATTGMDPKDLLKAQRRLDKAMEDADEHAHIATDPARRDALLAHVAVLFNSSALAELSPPSPWHVRTEPSVQARTEDAAPSVLPVRTEPAQDRTEPPAPSVRTDTRRVLESVRTDVEPPVRTARTEPEESVRTESKLPVRPIRTEPVRKPEPRTDDTGIDRDALVEFLTNEIRTSVAAGDKWSPDYDDLMKRSRRSRSWCEKVVGDAKRAVFPTDDDQAAAQLLGLRTPPRTYGPMNGHTVASAGGA